MTRIDTRLSITHTNLAAAKIFDLTFPSNNLIGMRKDALCTAKIHNTMDAFPWRTTSNETIGTLVERLGI